MKIQDPFIKNICIWKFNQINVLLINIMVFLKMILQLNERGLGYFVKLVKKDINLSLPKTYLSLSSPLHQELLHRLEIMLLHSFMVTKKP